jgi:hypothetical protein
MVLREVVPAGAELLVHGGVTVVVVMVAYLGGRHDAGRELVAVAGLFSDAHRATQGGLYATRESLPRKLGRATTVSGGRDALLAAVFEGGALESVRATGPTGRSAA